MAWQFNAKQPIYVQIVDHVLRGIVRGEYAPGDKLPSVRELALDAAVNPNTMQRAFSELENMGLVTNQRTSGRCVTTDNDVILKTKEELALKLTGEYLDRMKELGFNTDDVTKLIVRKEEQNG